MLENEEYIAQQISQILYTFVLYAEICTTFGSKVVQISVRNTHCSDGFRSSFNIS